MSKVQVYIINAFVDAGQGGNAAGLVLEADALSPAAKQRIAARVGLSETAFVSRSQVADIKLEFFTPARQIAHCGHATVATFSYLAQTGKIQGPHSSKETIDGNRAILLAEGMAFMEQSAPRYTRLADTAVSPAAVLESLALTSADLLGDHLPLVANTGNSFLLVPLRDLHTVAHIQPKFEQVSQLSEQLGVIGYYAFAPETRVAGRDAGVRMFAPFYGIPEESATGTAAGPLACFLFDHLHIQKQRLVIEQGQLMTPPKPSVLIADLTLVAGRIEKLMVGGHAAVSKVIEVEAD